MRITFIGSIAALYLGCSAASPTASPPPTQPGMADPLAPPGEGLPPAPPAAAAPAAPTGTAAAPAPAGTAAAAPVEAAPAPGGAALSIPTGAAGAVIEQIALCPNGPFGEPRRPQVVPPGTDPRLTLADSADSAKAVLGCPVEGVDFAKYRIAVIHLEGTNQSFEMKEIRREKDGIVLAPSIVARCYGTRSPSFISFLVLLPARTPIRLSPIDVPLKQPCRVP